MATSLAGEGGVSAAPSCDEGQRYLCRSGLVVDCAMAVGVGRCLRGCYAEGASVDDDDVRREAVFAILCVR
jgi:hypothetical protein